MIWIVLIIGGAILMAYSADHCTQLDVQSNRRDQMALVDDYGSNRGFYWPWSALHVLGALMTLVGIIGCFMSLT